MTKADRQVHEAIKRRQEVRRQAGEKSETMDDVEYCLDIIQTLKSEVERLEKVRR